MLYYKITNINPNKLLNDIQKIISQYDGDKSNGILVVRIIEPVSDDSTMIPKLEHKKM